MAPRRANPIVHLELHTGDVDEACALYAELCGWDRQRIEAGGGAYTALALGGEVGGGVVECDAGPSMWLPYVEVDDASEVTDRARRMGAEVLLEPREGPEGWRSVVASPAGGEVAFWQAKRRSRRRRGS
jgi:predicted enzyme related to lactoylglutathione lyase